MMRGHAPVLAAMVIGLVWSSCAAPSRAAAPWARTVANIRATADWHRDQHRYKAAETELRRIFEIEPPKNEPKAVWLLQDASFALGTVLYLDRRFEDAVAEADRGLSLGSDRSIFGANLHGLRAMALEAQGKPLDALTDYSRAIEIHKELFDTALAEHEGSKG